jgi:hypothetical protein
LFKDTIKDYILRYFEAGLRSYWKDFMDHNANIKSIKYFNKLDSTENDSYLNFADFVGAFWILLGGLALACLVFIVELIWHRFKFIQFKFVKFTLIRINWKKCSLDFKMTNGARYPPTKLGKPLKAKKSVKVFNKKDWRIKSRKCQLIQGELHIKFVVQSKKISEEKSSFFDMKFKRSGIVAFMRKSSQSTVN